MVELADKTVCFHFHAIHYENFNSDDVVVELAYHGQKLIVVFFG